MTRFIRASFAITVLVFVSFSALGQDYPMPVQAGSPPALCTACSAPYTNLPTAQFSTPIKRHVGRFIDSNFAREFQSPPRTLRAKGAWIVPERDRVYMHFGASRFATYKLSTFFTSDLGSPLEQISAPMRLPADVKEKYLPWFGHVDAEIPASGWITQQVDGQDRFIDFDWDDRDYVYMGYGPYGWGIVRDAGTGLLPKVSQITGSGGGIVSLKANGKYYAVLLDTLSSSRLYDVTNASSPQFVRNLPFGGLRWQRSDDHGFIMLANTSMIRIWRSADFILGLAPVATFEAPTGALIVDVSTDGSNYYAVENSGAAGGNIPRVWIIRYSGGSFSESRYTLPGGLFYPSTIGYGAGYVTVQGQDASYAGDLRLFRVNPGGLEEISLNQFFRNYYFAAPAGFAKPGNVIANHAFVYKKASKEYLIFSGLGMGDVYELETRPVIDVKIESATRGWGPQNPNSTRKTEGPFYGDRIPLTATYDAPATSVQWNFGNPEAGVGNSALTSTGVPVDYRYTGLTTAAAIAQTKTVTATALTDPTNTDSVSLTMMAPQARISVVGHPEILFTQPNATSSAAIVFGDQFVDASDGVLDSHTNTWTVDGVPSALTPAQPVSVGLCGAHSVLFAPRYGPASDYAPASVQVDYTVRPFVPAFTVTNNITYVRFTPATRFSPAMVNQVASYTWQVLNSGGAVIHQQSDGPWFDATTEMLQTQALGGSVRLLASIAAANIPELTCQAPQYLEAIASIPLVAPDPVIGSANCLYTNNCTLTVSSGSAASQTGWTYQWYINNVPSIGATAKIFRPTFPSPGTYTIKVDATSTIGLKGIASKQVTVQTPPCPAPPNKDYISFDWMGTVTGCVSCQNKEKMRFTPRDFAPWYKFQECDQFSWNFGDGSPSVPMDDPLPVDHDFLGNNSSYVVTLTVSNSAGNPAVITSTVQFGSTPPPPPPPPTCAKPTGFVSVSFTGNQGCKTDNPNCKNGESIAFTPEFWSFTPGNCHTYLWTFGDGTSSTLANPTKSYTSNGTKTVKVTVSGGGGSITGQLNINISGDGVPPPPPPGECTVAPNQDLLDFSYRGSQTQCSEAGGECSPAETVTFNASAWNYTFKSCDTITWNWGDGTANTVGTGVAATTATHVFAGANGTYPVTLTVSNAKGSAVVNRTVKMIGSGVALPREVAVQGPSTGTKNAPMTFTASAVVPPNGPVQEWNWNWADGSPQQRTTTPTNSHVYTRAGVFNMEVTAINAGGSTKVGKQIVITDGVQFAFMLPVVAHVSGRNGTVWKTDLHVFDPNHNGSPNEPLELTVEFGGMVKQLPITSATYEYKDFMTFLSSHDDAGPVIIRGIADRLPQIWTRTYNDTPGGTYGQLIPAVQMSTSGGDLVAEDSAYIAAGLRNDPAHRTNIGVVNLSPIPTDVEITVYDDRFERAIGSFTEHVEPYHLLQTGNLDLRIPDLPLRPFSVKFVSSMAVPLMAYASEVDNATNDPRFIAAARESSYASDSYKQQILPLIGTSAEWRTDATVFNLDSGAANIALSYFDSSGNKQKEITVPVTARSFVLLEDVMQRHLSLTGAIGGFLRVEVVGDPARNPIVTGSTYKLKDTGGSYGQGFPAFPAGAPNVKVSKPAFIAGVKNDEQYSTNIGLVNSGNESALVTIRLLDSANGSEVDHWSWALNPNQSLIRNIFEAMESTATGGTLKVEVSGGSVWAYASMFEKATGDPEYIPAVPGQ